MMEYSGINTCGCTVEIDKFLNTVFTYCPKHEAAPAMYEALEECKAWEEGKSRKIISMIREMELDALAQADRKG